MSYNPNFYQQQNYVNPYQNNYSIPSYNQNQYNMQQQQMYQNTQQQQQMQNQYMQQPNSNIEYVNGIEGAKALILPINCKKVVFDSDGQFFYIKTTDMQGKPTIKRFSYVDMDEPKNEQTQIAHEMQNQNISYATVDDVKVLNSQFESFKKEVINKLKTFKNKGIVEEDK